MNRGTMPPAMYTPPKLELSKARLPAKLPSTLQNWSKATLQSAHFPEIPF